MAMAAEASLAGTAEKPPRPSGDKAGAVANLDAASGHEGDEDARWRPVLGLPCELTVDLPLPGFKIADLLKLRAGSVIHAHWRLGRDVPLRLNGTVIGWSEFEVMGNNLAVRLTELA
jgi:flagellar motor switch/type III secretory pathway protein FliN